MVLPAAQVEEALLEVPLLALPLPFKLTLGPALVAPAPVQTPLTHFAPDLQTLPQAPQFLGALARVTQRPLHMVLPAAQPEVVLLVAPLFALPLALLFLADVPVHTPAMQCSPAPQTLPHPPQFLGAVFGFTQRLPHMILPDAQLELACAPAGGGMSSSSVAIKPERIARNPDERAEIRFLSD